MTKGNMIKKNGINKYKYVQKVEIEWTKAKHRHSENKKNYT